MIAYCGIKCTQCDAYLATQKNDAAKLAQLAADAAKRLEKDIKPSDVECDGCKAVTGRQIGFCSQCHIRACASDKVYETCAQCEELEACEKVAFITKHNPQALKNLLELRG